MSETSKYNQNLFDYMRIAPVKESQGGHITNESLVKAVTLNENLKVLGWTLKPEDVVAVAGMSDEEMDTLYSQIKSMTREVKAKPMYPDFPRQVMKMDEAQLRFHQMVHYFSTYGIESIFGVEVKRGWLPDVQDTEKTEEDVTLLGAKTIELIPEKEKYTTPMLRILSKKERMSDGERTIVAEAARSVSTEFLSSLHVPFKENMESLFMVLAENPDRKAACQNLRAICQHSGDALRFMEKYLNKNGFHLKTSEKKMFSRLLESFSAKDLRENLAQPESKKTRYMEVIRHLDYGKYAKNKKTLGIVKSYRELKSWHKRAWDMIDRFRYTKDRQAFQEAIDFIAQRPGEMLRMLATLNRCNPDGERGEKAITDVLVKNAGKLSVQSILGVINTAPGASTLAYTRKKAEQLAVKSHKAEVAAFCYSGKKSQAASRMAKKYEQEAKQAAVLEEVLLSQRECEFETIREQATAALSAKLQSIETPIRGKKVFLREEPFDLSSTIADPAHKSMGSGYIPDFTAVKIPDNVRIVRAFVYWNDKSRADLDLHGVIKDSEGRTLNIGWNSEYKNRFENGDAVFSGDITHSDAAEYVDIDFKNDPSGIGTMVYVGMNVDFYSWDGGSYMESGFSDLDECFVGLMAVSKTNENVKIYDPKNCFFTKSLDNVHDKGYQFGFIDVKNRTLYFIGKGIDHGQAMNPVMPEIRIPEKGELSVRDYLQMMAKAQGAEFVESEEEADIVLTMAKPENDKEISLIDNNFFYDASQAAEEVSGVESIQLDRGENVLEEEMDIAGDEEYIGDLGSVDDRDHDDGLR